MVLNSTVVVFDIGKVLLDWEPRHLFRRYFNDDAMMEEFLHSVCTPDWNRRLDGGKSFEPAVNQLCKRQPAWTDAIRAYDHRWQEMIAGPIDESVAILERLFSAGREVFAITNFAGDKYVQTIERFPFLTRFRGTIVSGFEGLLKPDPAIYRLLLTRYDLHAEACVFIDDSIANVAGARAVGMDAIHFVAPAQLAEQLSERCLL